MQGRLVAASELLTNACQRLYIWKGSEVRISHVKLYMAAKRSEGVKAGIEQSPERDAVQFFAIVCMDVQLYAWMCASGGGSVGPGHVLSGSVGQSIWLLLHAGPAILLRLI